METEVHPVDSMRAPLLREGFMGAEALLADFMAVEDLLGGFMEAEVTGKQTGFVGF